MAKKNNPKKSVQDKTVITKIAGQVGYMAAEVAAGKDRLVEMAGDAIGSVKSTIQEITSKKKTAAKKAAPAKVKKAVKKIVVRAAKKTASAVTKKTVPVKKAAKKLLKTAKKK